MPNGQDAIWNLRNVHLFKGLTTRELRELAPLLQTHDYHRGQFIFHMGEKADRLFFLDRGTVKTSRISPKARSAFWTSSTGAIPSASYSLGRTNGGSPRHRP